MVCCRKAGDLFQVAASVVIDIPVTITALSLYVVATFLTLPFCKTPDDYMEEGYIPLSEKGDVCPKCGERIEPPPPVPAR